MSPIKTRKEIISPNLNFEQNNFLNLCAFYKSDNFVSFSGYSNSKVNNSSMTPVTRKEPNMIPEELSEEEVKSCSKLETSKKKHGHLGNPEKSHSRSPQ